MANGLGSNSDILVPASLSQWVPRPTWCCLLESSWNLSFFYYYYPGLRPLSRSQEVTP